MTLTTFTYEQLEGWVSHAFWPFLRIGACLMVAPMFSASYVPARVRIVLAGALTLIALPVIPHTADITLLSADGVITTIQQIVIGAALGFVVQLIFDAINFGGQVIANGMGLGLAFNIDPLLNIETPALGQLYVMLGTLTFLALDGHLALVDTLVTSFRGLPIGPAGLSVDAMRSMAEWGDQLFVGALKVALPGMTALLVVNLAFGAVSRAAPALNMFAIGLPVTLIFGLVVLLFGLPSMQSGFTELMKTSFQFLQALTGTGVGT
jgi:flagellar biosynthetic protein FliR